MGRLDGKVAIITGGGQGIGKGIALRFTKEGAKVVIAEIKEDVGRETEEELKNMGLEITFMPCDVGSKDQIYSTVSKTVDVYGPVDILVNNAQGIIGERSFEEATEEEMHFCWKTGAMASVHFMQACFPYMKERTGKIINFASATGMFGVGRQLPYGSNKEAIRGITKMAAKEWGQYQITVNCILPYALSPAAQAWALRNPELHQHYLKATPIGRAGDPEKDIGGIALFLASSDSDYITGQMFMADGGTHILP